MYIKNEQNQHRAEKLYNYIINNKKYGDIIKYKDIEEIIEINPQSNQGYLITTKTNTMLESERMQLVTIKDVGKRVLNPNEHVSASRNIAKKAIKPIKKSVKLLNATNLDQLTQSEQRQCISEANKYKILISMAEEVRKQDMIINKDKKWTDKDKFKLLELFSN